MIKRCAQLFSAAAVPLIQAKYVESGDPGLFCSSQNVTGLTRSFEAVQEDNRRVPGRIFLPMTFTAHLCSRFDFKEPGDAAG